MHPVIRIISFVILAGFIALGDENHLAAGVIIIAGVVLFTRFRSMELSIRIIKRMRWFFLSILIVYLWFTPGRPLLEINSSLIPTIEGLQTGLLRILSLVLIILAVNLFVSLIARDRLIEAIVWLLRPVTLVGIDHRVLALRIALTLELIPKVQSIALDVKEEHQQRIKSLSENGESDVSVKSKIAARISAITSILEAVFGRVIESAVTMESSKVEIISTRAPPLLQWIIPLLLCALFVGLGLIVND